MFLVFDKVADDGRILEASIDPDVETAFYSTNVVLIKKYLLEELVTAAHSKNKISFQRNILLESIKSKKVYSYDATDCFVGTIDSVQSYYDVSMSILDRENKKKLFAKERPIYTKERDDMPTLYGMEADVKNSLVADGCVVKGTVENCILFKGVKIKEGAVVKNSILMQDTVIGENVKINYVIADKDCNIKSDVELSGAANYPVCISKGTKI